LARALIVGCGCRGRALGRRLAEADWAVRGTTRSEKSMEAIEAAGIEAAVADPEAPRTVLDLVGDVTVVHWLLGSAGGEPETVEAIHGPRLERMLEKLVDTPVRGFVYEAEGSTPAVTRAGGRRIVEAAASTWRIPVAFLEADPGEPATWADEAVAATTAVLRVSD
jgi:nucleoside-diphosphate-sugar epimerase